MSDSVYLTLGTIVGWLGAAVAVFALFSDWIRQRFRPGCAHRKRCPKCWYDLSHAPPPGLTCSECGYVAKHERKLFKARKRWKLVWLALPILLGSYALRVTPDIKQRGWVACVPTTVLIGLVPALRPDIDVVDDHRWSFQSSNRTVSLENQIYIELLAHRIDDERLWGWQAWTLERVCDWIDPDPMSAGCEWDGLADRLLAAMHWRGGVSGWQTDSAPMRITPILDTRMQWPTGTEMYGRVLIEGGGTYRFTAEPLTPEGRGFSDSRVIIMCGTGLPPPLWSDELFPLGTATTALKELSYQVNLRARENLDPIYASRWRTIMMSVVSGPVQPVARLEDVVSPIDSTSFDDRLRSILRPEIVRGWFFDEPENVVALELGVSEEELLEALAIMPNTTLAYTCEIMSGDRVIASGQAWNRIHKDGSGEHCWPYPLAIRLQFNDESTNALRDPLMLRVRGDGHVALRDLQATQYWRGEIIVPVAANISVRE